MTDHFRSMLKPQTLVATSGAPITDTCAIKLHLTLHLLLAFFLATFIAGIPACSGLLLNNGGASYPPDIVAQNSLEFKEATPINSTMDYLLRALDGLDKAFQFFQREFRHVNLDAIIGTRVVQASLKVLLERLARFNLMENVPPYVIDHIRKLRDLAGDVSDFATPYIIASEPDYYKSIGPILDEDLFAMDYDSRDIPEGVTLWQFKVKEAMKEMESDGCLAEVLGSKTGVPCDISSKCWGRMTRLGYSGYSLSHEIFYLQIAEMIGCQKEMQWQMVLHQQRGLRDLQDTFCANMLAEAKLIADYDFPARERDLFMEQAALCGMLGYRQFFTSDWLVKILSWQDPKDGCYRWAGWTLLKDGESRLDLVVRANKRRSKREEKRVSRDCLCHRTAVAAAALSLYVRFVLEVWLDEQQLS